jgi:hypothetical protein
VAAYGAKRQNHDVGLSDPAPLELAEGWTWV